MYTYLLINCASIAIPFLLSFEKRVEYYKKWKQLFPAILLMAVIFIAWDSLFTKWAIWGFNPDYLSGIYILNLPIEEILFFFCIPYSCLFIYEVIRYFDKKDIFYTYRRNITKVLILVLGILTVIYSDRLYTSVTFSATTLFLLYILISKKDNYLGRFYFAYLISLLPFFIVNGILTGSGLESPIVWYNDAENMGIRLGTIPLDDTVYSLLMLLLTTHIYEQLRQRKLS